MNAKPRLRHRIGVLVLAGTLALGAIVPGHEAAASAAPRMFDRPDDLQAAAPDWATAFDRLDALDEDEDDELTSAGADRGGPNQPVGAPADNSRPITREEMLNAKAWPAPAGQISLREVEAVAEAADGPPGLIPGVPPPGREARGGPDVDDLLLGPAFAIPSTGYRRFPFVTAGKVFFRVPGGIGHCSGASIGNFAIWTAGHCVFTRGIGFHTDLAFVPAYQNGAEPFGRWSAHKVWTVNGWSRDGSLSFDYGGAILKRLSGKKISERVGFLGFAWNQPRGQRTFLALGWPREPSPKYNGQTLHGCSGQDRFVDATKRSPYPRGFRPCDSEGGSSGGPWIPNGTSALGGNESYSGRASLGLSDVTFSPYFNTGTKGFKDFLVRQVPAAPCGRETKSGGQGVTRNVHDMGANQGRFDFTYDAFGIPDKFEIFYENRLIFTTGAPVSGRRTVEDNFGPGNSTELTVVVTGPTSGTAWTYTLGCPEQT